MALNGDTLGLAMLAAVNAVGDKTDRTALFKAMGNAIVTHIQTQGQVVVISVTGVTPGGGVSGPGTGTIT
jgi:hypothetical protein